jgi:hypothetical protein
MVDLIMPRRKFLTGLMGLVAAPAVVKAANIMPVKVITPQWFANDGTGLVSMAHPVRTGGGIRLSELRELLRPGIEKMIDEMYTEHPGQWKSIFAGETDG